jgi:hypothetical protein
MSAKAMTLASAPLRSPEYFVFTILWFLFQIRSRFQARNHSKAISAKGYPRPKSGARKMFTTPIFHRFAQEAAEVSHFHPAGQMRFSFL